MVINIELDEKKFVEIVQKANIFTEQLALTNNETLVRIFGSYIELANIVLNGKKGELADEV
ncbi:MAG: hypothetical protein WC279_08310 [Sulfurimonas sp.]|jgi:hypothetical protein|uniref:hypothetical protein n=1 Tax=Sulfurimonas sp. TaxID=2022749 RepID=UPI003565042A